MKNFLRIFAATLLCITLLFFSLWKNDILPDLAGITAFMQQAAGKINNITTQVEQAAADLIGGPAPSDEGAEYPDITLSDDLDADLETAVCRGFDAYAATIDLSSFDLAVSDANAVLSQIRLSHPEYFYLGDITYFHSGGTVSKLEVQYLYDADTVADMTVTYEAALAEIVAGVPTECSDFDKLLYLHDYFIEGYCYDYTYTIRDAYTFFTQKTGVCQAYMLALIAVAEEIGIESIPVTSNAMKHAWNLVKLDGEWYHVDLTWDDVDSLPTHTSYTYFLLSDVGLVTADQDLDEPHREWQTTEVADSTVYDAAVWHEASTEILKADGVYYCTVPVASTGFSSEHYALYGGSDPIEMTKISGISAIWRTANPSYRHINSYAGLAAWDGKIIYNTQNALYVYDPETGKSSVKLLSVSSDMSVYGIVEISAEGVVQYILDYKDISGEPTYGYYNLQLATAA